MIDKWDKRFLDLAVYISSWSKDPSTKVGAVIANGKKVVSLGFNGFPEGVDDSLDRLGDKPTKYSMVVHAEANAILTAKQDLYGCTLYCTLFTCNECAKLIIQSGIKKVVCLQKNNLNWEGSFSISKRMYDEAGVVYE